MGGLLQVSGFLGLFRKHQYMSSHSMCHATPRNATKFPAALIFGDSTVDSGNNDYMLTVFKANHLPYGMNSPGGQPTGRFSDGMLVPDFLASSLGLKESIPPFWTPSCRMRILRQA
ncbi:GDSL esterase/lipase [Acorus calamus]|uniref:GDSL esterase/lipase n=1 Tax=Acorus calamus TaxID=4465 RepID=A0AAV9EG88_ACOCL|nr:GDSL esterase/lipase [Acorus calamus]